jgi:N-methylhydantoinase A/oxoprolinase/acetone carboxylase beta subunit
MMDWPADFVDAVGRNVFSIRGGYQFDGRLNAELDELAVASAAREMKAKGLKAASVCGLFSPLNAAMEERAAAIIQQEAPEIAVTLSSRIGRIGAARARKRRGHECIALRHGYECRGGICGCIDLSRCHSALLHQPE